MADIFEISGRIHSTSQEEVVTTSSEIIDEEQNNKKQSEINADVQSELNAHDEAINAPSTGLEARVETLEEQVAFSGDFQTANTPADVVSGSGKITTANAVAAIAEQLKAEVGYYQCTTAAGTAAKVIPASAAPNYVLTVGGSVKVKMTNKNTAANPTLKIGNAEAKPLYYGASRASSSNTWEAGEVIEVYYDGENLMANNVEGGGGDGVFDISAYNASGEPIAPAVYENLTAALGASGANVPASKRKGGMSVKFIQGTEQSSDNNYVQFRYMPSDATTTATFTDVSNWQGVDEIPTAGSQNLVTSGGVEEKTKGIVNEDLPFGTTDDEIQIQDNEGNTIHRFNESYADLKNLKSNGKIVATVEDIEGKQDKIKEISQTSTFESDDEIQIQDNEGNSILVVDKNRVKVKEITNLNGDPIIPIPEDYKYKDYIDVNYNSSAIAPFLLKYTRRIVDDFGQLSIHLCGDSIFGRQDKGATWNPSNPEMSLTPDMNDPNETQPGYITGHFPPNAWEQLVGYRLIKALQYSNSEVKYYNHVSAEVTKVGIWTDLFPAGADSLRLCSNSASNDSISLAFSGAKYAKFIVSNYGASTSNANIKVEVSEDGGTTFNTPAELGLTESHENSGVSGEHSLSDLATIKFAELCWRGFDSEKSYIIRVTHTNSSGLRVWGFETWNNPRINVVNCAQGGNVASNQNANPRRFYNSNSKPSLVIYELPYLNDLGTGIVPNYGGFITPTSVPIETPANEYTYCCNEDGVYTNFGNIKAYKYDYISYSSDEGKWVHGSPKIDRVLATYLEQCETSLKMVKRVGIPVLTIIPHNSNTYNQGRRFMLYDGINILRCLTKKYGYATIDLNAYQMSLPDTKVLTNSPSDGTHLNDVGSALYADMITQIVAQKPQNSIGSSSWDNNSFYGEGTPGNVVFEGNIELSAIPKICILDNNSITVTNVTNTGFTATGSGVFTYKAILNV